MAGQHLHDCGYTFLNVHVMQQHYKLLRLYNVIHR